MPRLCGHGGTRVAATRLALRDRSADRCLAGDRCRGVDDLQSLNSGEVAYLLVVSVIGVAAFPKSPLWAPLLLSPLFILAGYGVLA